MIISDTPDIKTTYWLLAVDSKNTLILLILLNNWSPFLVAGDIDFAVEPPAEMRKVLGNFLFILTILPYLQGDVVACAQCPLAHN